MVLANSKVGPGVPVGEEVVDSQGADPGSEPLVEPQVVPPLHGDQISKPLMGNLVGDSVGDLLLHVGSRGLLIVKKRDSAVCDQTPILHCTGIKVRDSDVVQLCQWVRSAKDLGEVLEDFGSNLKSEAALLNQTRQGIHATDNGGLELGGGGLDVFKVADRERYQL